MTTIRSGQPPGPPERRTRSALPTFSPAPTETDDLEETATPSTPTPTPGRPPATPTPGPGVSLRSVGSRLGLLTPSAAPTGIPTLTSTTTDPSRGELVDEHRPAAPEPPVRAVKPEPVKVDPELLAKAAAAVVGIVAVGAAMAVRFRYGGRFKLRTPTEVERTNIADPLGRIIGRRVRHIGNLHDVVDVLAAVTGVGDYVSAGDLMVPALPTFTEES